MSECLTNHVNETVKYSKMFSNMNNFNFNSQFEKTFHRDGNVPLHFNNENKQQF